MAEYSPSTHIPDQSKKLYSPFWGVGGGIEKYSTIVVHISIDFYVSSTLKLPCNVVF